MKQVVNLVWHSHVVAGSEDDVKLLGVYSTEQLARSRVEEARLLPGFRDAPDGSRSTAASSTRTGGRRVIEQPTGWMCAPGS